MISPRHQLLRALFVMFVAIALSVSSSACQSCSRATVDEEDAGSPTRALLREFEGSYATSASPVGIVKSFDIVAAPAKIRLGDGPPVDVWAYNGTVPGPTLRIRLGETLRVRFVNRLPQPTTIHWHGVRVPNAMDGVPHATQPPIAPGETFVYEFTPKDAGTFWFHPHVRGSEQVERGLYGVLVVEDREPPPYAKDVVWVLDDFLLDEGGQIDSHFNTGHDLAHDGRWGNLVTVNGSTKETLALRSGERVRLRLVNTANGRMFKPDFSRFDAKIIAVDGMYLREPIDPAGFEIAPGNRVDLDLGAVSSASERLYVVDRFVASRPNRLAAIVVDEVAGPAVPFPTPAHAHVPAWRGALSMPIEHDFHLNARRGGELGIEWTIDDKAFAGHEHPASLTLERGKFYRLRFTNESYRLHPIHLHGMFFRLLARNGAAVDEPFFRDTVLIHGKEIIDIGVVPVDEGTWMMHCHILEHAEAGMMTMLEVRR
jgi:FtsP/CotA-like multicopper oxidase with cupredoxin domain